MGIDISAKRYRRIATRIMAAALACLRCTGATASVTAFADEAAASTASADTSTPLRHRKPARRPRRTVRGHERQDQFGRHAWMLTSVALVLMMTIRASRSSTVAWCVRRTCSRP